MLDWRIRELRLRLNMSQKTFADELGVSIHTLRNWEQGKRTPDVAMLLYIADKYDISLDWILGRKRNNDDLREVYEVLQKMIDICENMNKDKLKRILLEK